VAKSESRAGKSFLPQRELAQDVYTLALERTANTFASFDHVAVLFSGGKDSTAVLNIALEVAHSDPRFARHLPLRAIFFDEEAIPAETEEYVRCTFARPDVAGEWYCIPIKHRNACSRKSPWWWPWAPEAEDLWCRPLPPEAITSVDGFPVWPAEDRLTNPAANGLFFPPGLGNCAMLMGIRAQESLTRRRAVTRKRGENYLNKFDDGTSCGNIWKSYPVYDWTHQDVWTAAAVKGWDTNAAYDRLEMAGVPIGMQRCSPAFGEEPLQKIHTYAQCFPEVWDKMVARVPGVGAAARYALTELYSYRGRPDKPAGMPWPEFVVHYAQQFRPEDTAFIADRLRKEIRVHYQYTTDPIVGTAPHPMTGVSWDFLLMLAMRGDFKGRKQPGGRIRNDDLHRPEPRFWHRYASELAGIIAAGRFAELAYPGAQPADPRALVPAYAREGMPA
jgi:predicted phosphoadenosine phosphosulfate sulfurtransferase